MNKTLLQSYTAIFHFSSFLPFNAFMHCYTYFIFKLHDSSCAGQMTLLKGLWDIILSIQLPLLTCNERSKGREITLSMHIVLHFPSIYCLLFRQSLFKASLGILIKILSCAIWTCILWFLCFSCTVFAYLIFSPSQLFKAFLL